MREAREGEEPSPYHFDISELGETMSLRSLRQEQCSDLKWKEPQDVHVSYFDVTGRETLSKQYSGVLSLSGHEIVAQFPEGSVAFVVRYATDEVAHSGVICPEDRHKVGKLWITHEKHEKKEKKGPSTAMPEKVARLREKVLPLLRSLFMPCLAAIAVSCPQPFGAPSAHAWPIS